MQTSERTKHCRTMKWIFTILHWLCLLGPFTYYLPYCFINGETTQKVVVGLGVVIAIALLVVALVIDIKHRTGLQKSAFWAVICVCVWVLQQLSVPFIIIMAVVSIMDEAIFIPLKDKYANLQMTNKEIDRRA